MQTQSTYTRTEKGQAFAKKAYTKMIVWYLDKNIRTMHSRDFRGNSTFQDRNLGITRLKKNALKNKASIETAKIYDNKTGAELYTFRDGYWR